MDSIEALKKVYNSLSRGASVLDFSPSDITGECVAAVHEIVRQRKSGAVSEDALNSALLCLNDGNGLVYLGLISAGLGHWNCSIKAYEKALSIFGKLGDVHGAAQTYGNLGLVYANMGEWNKAIEFYQKDLEISEKLGDVHGKGITLSNIGKLHLDKAPQEPEAALGYLEESIKLINKEARPHYPNALNRLALCYHMLGSNKKALAKREKDNLKRENLVNTAAALFSDASKHYSEVAGMPRVNLPSLWMYAHLDKGLSFSVKNIMERDEAKALERLDSAIKEFKQALKFADEKDRLRLEGIISEHEAKRHIRRAAIERSIKNQNKMLDRAVEALQNAVGYFEKLGDEKQCDIKTCDGCRHLFKGLRSFRMGIKENSKKLIDEAVSELHEARLCYDGALNELGKDTVEILNKSFDYVDELIESEDKERTTKVTREFIKIIDELSSAGLQKIVKLYTFDESMNVKGEITKKSESLLDRLANIATLAGFFGWASGLLLLIYGYAQSNVISLIIGIIIFVFLAALKLKKR